MGVKQIKIEDIEVDIPTGIDDRWSKSTRRTITGGLLTQRKTQNRGTIGLVLSYLTETQADQLLELQRNYAYNSTVVTGISRAWDARLVLDSIKIEYRWYNREANISGSLQLNPTWNFIGMSQERPLHNRWKYVVQEDFTTDGDWPGQAVPVSTPLTSSGYGRQEQDIVWNEIAGNFNGNTTIKLVNSKALYSGTESEDVIVAGFDWWDNYEVSVWCWTNTSASDDFGIVFRCTDINTHYLFEKTGTTTLSLKKDDTGYTTIATYNGGTIAHQKWHQMKVVCQGSRIRCFFAGELIFDEYDGDIAEGNAGFRSVQSLVFYDDCRVTLLPAAGYNLPSEVSRTKEFTTSVINTAHGEQKQLVVPSDVKFNLNYGDDCALSTSFDEGSGTPQDKSKYGNVTTLTGGTWVEDDEGTCIEFNGSSDVLTIDDNPVLDTDLSTVGAIVWEAEVKFDAVNDSTYHAIIMKDGCYHIQHNTSNQIQLYVYESGADSNLTWTYSSDLEANVWYRMTFVWIEGDWMGIFVDGDMKASKTPTGGTLSVSADDLEIGGNDANGRWFDGRIKNVRIYKHVQEDVIFGFDRTPATVFTFDDEGTTDARYRTTTLMYDLNVMTRVYDKGRPWTGRPVVTNGLVTLSFPEISSIVWPLVHAWVDNNWVTYGSIQPIEERNGIAIDITDATGYEWIVEELTDQYCKIRVTWYMDSTAGIPEGSYTRLWLTVRNGYPGVLIESDRDNPSVGWLVEFQGYGSNGTEVIAFLPDDTTLDVRAGGTTSYSMTDVDGHWLMCYTDAEDYVKGMFVDSIRDDGGNMWIVTDTSNLISDVRCYGKYGGVFYMEDTNYPNKLAIDGMNDIKVRRY